jgi:ADP-heptose:LPS heptosyltransferase
MESLVYHAGALGDFITALPAIDLWREAHSDHRHILLGRPAHAALALPAFDDVWDAGSAAFAPLFSMSDTSIAPLTARIGDLTSAIVFASNASPLPLVLSRCGVKVLRQDPFPASPIHVVDYHLSLFPRSAREGRGIPRVAFPSEDLPRDVAAIHPGSGSALKNWPLAHYAKLAALLRERDQGVAWIVGPAEQDHGPFQAVVRGTGHPEVWNSLPLPALAARLAQCRLYVGNDSGVTHLAAATGCPTVALFGGSDPRSWSPRGANVEVIDSRGRGMRAIRVEDVLRVCLELLREK